MKAPINDIGIWTKYNHRLTSLGGKFSPTFYLAHEKNSVLYSGVPAVILSTVIVYFVLFFFLSHSVIASWLNMGFTLPRNGSYLSVPLCSIINSSSWIFLSWQNILRIFHPKSMRMTLMRDQIHLKNIAFSTREKQTIKPLLSL